MKVLNLYAGIGGNRKLWKDVEVTAIEINPKIAVAYQKFFPDDRVVVADAHKFLLEHFREFDFIWSSPPCQSHSKMRLLNIHRGICEPQFPDMKLYEEIIFCQNWVKCNWVIENVIPYYKPLIEPQISGRHAFWANFMITRLNVPPSRIKWKPNAEQNRAKRLGYDISDVAYSCGQRSDQIINNCTEPEIGLHVFDCAFRIKQKTLTGGGDL
jgi:DNA (cytosine-5)-methyltransferase 1